MSHIKIRSGAKYFTKLFIKLHHLNAIAVNFYLYNGRYAISTPKTLDSLGFEDLTFLVGKIAHPAKSALQTRNKEAIIKLFVAE